MIHQIRERCLADLEQKIMQLPEVLAGKNLIQNEYHQFDVYDHTLAVINALKELNSQSSADLIASACLHDIGKPAVAQQRVYGGVLQVDEQGRPRHTFPNHESVGATMVRNLDPKLFEDLQLNQELIAKFVGAHYSPMKGIGLMRKARNPQEFEQSFYKLHEFLSNQGLNLVDLMNLFAADSIGKGDIWGDLQELLAVRSAILGKNNLRAIYEMQKIHGGNKYGYAKKE